MRVAQLVAGLSLAASQTTCFKVVSPHSIPIIRRAAIRPIWRVELQPLIENHPYIKACRSVAIAISSG